KIERFLINEKNVLSGLEGHNSIQQEFSESRADAAKAREASLVRVLFGYELRSAMENSLSKTYLRARKTKKNEVCLYLAASYFVSITWYE
ncbi:hypothetical protein CEXT_332491, partial [Caerostris extrusa]